MRDGEWGKRWKSGKPPKAKNIAPLLLTAGVFVLWRRILSFIINTCTTEKRREQFYTVQTTPKNTIAYAPSGYIDSIVHCI